MKRSAQIHPINDATQEAAPQPRSPPPSTRSPRSSNYHEDPSIIAADAVRACQGEEFEKRGVTIALLKALKEVALQVNTDVGYWSIGRFSAEVMGNHELLKAKGRWGDALDKAKTLTYAAKCSLIEVLHREYPTIERVKHPRLGVTYDEAVGAKATAFVSFAYSDNFIELVGSLEQLLKDEPVKYPVESTFFWFDMIVNDQWSALEKSFDWWATTFREAVKEINNTICFFAPWNDPTVTKRAWCLFEISCSDNLSILVSERQKQDFQATLRADHHKIMSSLCNINLETADCFLKEDKDRIFSVVNSSEGGIHAFNIKVLGLIRTWITSSTRDMIAPYGWTWKEGVPSISGDDTITAKDLQHFRNAALVLQEQGNYKEAKSLFLHVWKGTELLLGPDDTETISALFSVAGSLYHEGNFAEAKRMFEKTAGEYERIGVLDVNYFSAVGNVATCLEDQHSYDDAMVLRQKVLEGKTRLYGTDHIHTVDAMNSVASNFKGQKKYDEAAHIYEKVLKDKERILGVNDIDTLSLAFEIAGFYSSRGKKEESMKLYERVKEGFERTLGLEHPSTLKVYNNIAVILIEERKFEDAIILFEKVLKGFEEIHGPDHHLTHFPLTNIAEILLRQNKFKECLPFQVRVVKGKESILGLEHLDTISSAYNLGIMQMFSQNYTEAHLLFDRVFKVRDKLLGAHDEDTLSALYMIGAALISNENFKEAQVALEKLFQRQEIALGANHPDTLCTLANLAKVFFCLDKFEEAINAIERLLQIQGKDLGLQNIQTLSVLNEKCRALFRLNRFEEAKAELEILCPAWEQALGPNHKDTLNALSNLANVLKKLKKFEEAKAIYERVLQAQELILGLQHEDAIATANELGKYEKWGDDVELSSVINNEKIQTQVSFNLKN